MKIITKYVLREHVGPLMFALCALTSLLILNYIAKQLAQLAGKGLPWTVIAEFLALTVPFTIAMTLPMAVLVAVLYAFTRLASENEISALKANGVAMGSLLAPVAIGATILAFVMLAFNDQVLPRSNHRLATLQRDIARKKPTFALREQVLNEVIPSRGLSIRTDNIDRASQVMHGVHLYDISQPERIRNIHAESAHIGLTQDQRDLILKLYDGYVVDIDRKNPYQLNRAYFEANQMRIEGVGNELRRVETDAIKGEREQSICDMQQEYDTARVKIAARKAEFKAKMRQIVNMVASGEGSMMLSFEEPPPEDATSWGSIYCSATSILERVLPRQSYDMMNDASADSAEAEARRRADSVRIALEELRQQTSGNRPLDTAYTGVNPQDDPTAYQNLAASYFGESAYSELDGIKNTMHFARIQMARFSVEIHKKFALAGACIVFVLIGVPFALRFPRGGVGIVIGASLVLFAISYAGLIAGEGLAKGGSFSPFLAMWGANFLIAAAGIAMMLRMGKESMTRGSTVGAFIDDLRERIAWRRRGNKP